MSDFFLRKKEKASYKELFSYTSIQRIRKQPTDTQAADGCTRAKTVAVLTSQVSRFTWFHLKKA
jgi:hypothetical protein